MGFVSSRTTGQEKEHEYAPASSMQVCCKYYRPTIELNLVYAREVHSEPVNTKIHVLVG
jgi:hypothetical protein